MTAAAPRAAVEHYQAERAKAAVARAAEAMARAQHWIGEGRWEDAAAALHRVSVASETGAGLAWRLARGKDEDRPRFERDAEAESEAALRRAAQRREVLAKETAKRLAEVVRRLTDSDGAAAACARIEGRALAAKAEAL